MNTSSLNFPNIFNVSRNTAGVLEDRASVVNRVRLLLLTEPSELYMSPTYGVGLKRYLYQYNTDNVVAQIRERLVEQLRLWEPSVNADATEVVKGLTYTNPDGTDSNFNKLNLTITLYTIYGDKLTMDIEENAL